MKLNAISVKKSDIIKTISAVPIGIVAPNVQYLDLMYEMNY